VLGKNFYPRPLGRVFPELRKLAWQHHGEAQPHPYPAGRGDDPPTFPVRRARPHTLLIGVRLPVVDGKQLAAVCRIKALRRQQCCSLPVLCWGGAGVPGRSGGTLSRSRYAKAAHPAPGHFKLSHS
jgi:hypothetical protein